MPIREMHEDHTLFSLINAINGYANAQIGQKKDQWYQTRMLCYYAAGGDAHKTPDEWLPLPWEKEEPKAPDPESEITPEELKLILKQK